MLLRMSLLFISASGSFIRQTALKYQPGCHDDLRAAYLPGTGRYVRMVCPENGVCGGIGDRIKGAAIALAYGILSDRRYLPAQWPSPVSFHDYFEHGMEPGEAPSASEATFSMVDSPHAWRNSELFSTSATLVTIRANQFEEAYAELLANDGLSPAARSRMPQNLTSTQVLSCLLPLVYGLPRPSLAIALDRAWPGFASSLHKKVGVHMRTGVTTWPDPRRMPDMDQIAPLWLSHINEVVCPREERCVLVMVSDSEPALEQFTRLACGGRHACVNFSAVGPVMHVDRSPVGEARAYERSFVEFLALHYVDHLVAPLSQFSQIPRARMRLPASVWGSDGLFTMFSSF
jgi:hypothetical protein